MTIGKLVCILMIGAIVYLCGVFSGAAIVEKSNEIIEREKMEESEAIRKRRRIRYQERQCQLEGKA